MRLLPLATDFRTEPPVGFALLEWLVIAIGCDRHTVPLAASHHGRALLRLVDHRQAAALEALRRAAVLASRHSWGLPACEIRAFLAKGWSEEQLELLINSLDPPISIECRTCSNAPSHSDAHSQLGPDMTELEILT